AGAYEACTFGGLTGQSPDGLRNCLWIVRRNQQCTGATVGNEGDAAHGRCDDGQPRSHGFDQHDAKGFLVAAEQKDVSVPHDLRNVVGFDCTTEFDPVVNAQFDGEGLESAP